MKRLAAPVVSDCRLRAGVARRRQRRLRRDGHGGEERCRRAPAGLRLVRQPARLHEATCPAARRAVGVRRRGGREGLGRRGASRRARPPERPASTTRRRTCRRRASTSPTWSSRTARRCSSSAPTGSSPSTCAHGSRAWPAPCSCRRIGSYELLLHGDRLLVLSHGGVYAIDTPVGRASLRSLPRRPVRA